MLMVENGIFENTQVIVCSLAFSFFIAGAIINFSKGRADQSSVSLTLGMIPFVGAGRELSFGRVLGFSRADVMYTKYIMSIILVSSLITALVFLILSVKKKRFILRDTTSGWPFFSIAVISIVVAQLLEKGQIGLPKNQNLEELFELVGYLSLFYLSAHRIALSYG